MAHFNEGEIIRFTNESGKSVRINGATIQPHGEISITLKKSWNDQKGLGEGGPWGWGGYTTALVKSLGDIDTQPDR